MLTFSPSLYFIKGLPPLSSIIAPTPTLPRKTRSSPKATLVLDLDETLVHCSTVELASPDHVFDVQANDFTIKVYLRQRPHLRTFLERAAQLFEVVLFTASQRVYANQVLDIIDRERRFIKCAFWRQARLC